MLKNIEYKHDIYEDIRKDKKYDKIIIFIPGKDYSDIECKSLQYMLKTVKFDKDEFMKLYIDDKVKYIVDFSEFILTIKAYKQMYEAYKKN